uniref:BED-type domain-containing protein n=1 Tax=Setaria viridis TaxID=4556 RepID=A0A4V6DDD3_SETVI|nr:hypothetical protein SEVIR_1G288800v2 [Setaria viridis]
MDDMEEYTINDNLTAYGLPGNDEDDVIAGGEALLSSSVAPINVDGGDDVSAARGVGVGVDSSMTQTSSTFTDTSGQLKHVRSAAWNDFEEIYETLPNGKKVIIAAKCRHCSRVLSGRSCASTGHLLRHKKVCVAKANHAVVVQSRL